MGLGASFAERNAGFYLSVTSKILRDRSKLLALPRSIGFVQYVLPHARFLCVVLCDPAK